MELRIENRIENIEDKIFGAIYGFAIGDAMGATTEFMHANQIKKEFGQVTDIIGGGWLNLKPGEVTDDTQMTICIMAALIGKSTDEDFTNLCVRNFIKWYKSKPKDIGNQCRKGIEYYLKAERCTLINDKFIPEDEDAQGNGSLMRAMPCALLNESSLNVMQGWLTHNNLECTMAILEYTKLIQSLMHSNEYSAAVTKLMAPTGHVKNTLNNAIYWSMKPTFEEAIIGAVNDGGDADTIAAIAGSLAGVRFGYKAIPEKWIDKLDSNVKRQLKVFGNFAVYVEICKQKKIL